MATHSNVLAWRIPGTGEPGGLPSMGLHRVRHDWSDLAAAAGPQLNTLKDFLLNQTCKSNPQALVNKVLYHLVCLLLQSHLPLHLPSTHSSSFPTFQSHLILCSWNISFFSHPFVLPRSSYISLLVLFNCLLSVSFPYNRHSMRSSATIILFTTHISIWKSPLHVGCAQ